MISTHLGFNYDFDALNVHGSPSELSTALTTLFTAMSQSGELMQLIANRVWLLNMIVRPSVICTTIFG